LRINQDKSRNNSGKASITRFSDQKVNLSFYLIFLATFINDYPILKMLKNFLFLLAAIILTSCGSTKKVTLADSSGNKETMERRALDTVVVQAPREISPLEEKNWELPRYNPSATRTIDLLHTDLDLRFNWEKEWVIGLAELRLKPYFHSTSTVELDAVNFEVQSIKLLPEKTELDYDNDGKKLKVYLPRKFTRSEEIRLLIDYIARPAEVGSSQGGAISSNQGLFFINPRGEEDKPMQIWTQGETEYNSRWFPTIDKPNERCTQEISLTVQDRFKTLSNGVLTTSSKNPDGTRTDTWKMEQPHAPYLFMLAIGEFAVVEDEWNGIPLYYYVEPEYEEDARAIFDHTPEMLTFFSDILGYPYPWPKYAQVVVRDYVSGAMENTSAVIFGSFVQQKSRELIDNNNDGIVAHEMFHHWFGDLVTCESWANLTLNEGFANYSEYLWNEHHYGRDYADNNRRNELRGYVSSAQRNAHDLIYYDYPDKEMTFDAHSYNKGGLVLHMLRKYVGDEAFFAALKKYLTDNAYSDVEADELRLAFEEITGEDLNWFFNQWYFESGHPILSVDHNYDQENGLYSITLEQSQSPEAFPPIFQLPFAIDIYKASGEVVREQVFMDQREQTFTFNLEEAPALVNVDAEDALLCEMYETLSDEEYVFQYRNAPLFEDRIEALEALEDSEVPEASAIRTEALSDPFWGIRRKAIQGLSIENEALLPKIEKMALEDKHSRVRAAAIELLGDTENPKYIELAKKVIDTDLAYRCISAALRILNRLDESVALEYSTKLEKDANSTLLGAIGNIYSANPDPKYAPFFENNWEKVSGFAAFDFFNQYNKIILSMEPVDQDKSLEKLQKIALESGSPFRRFAAASGMNGLRRLLQEDDDESTEQNPLIEMITRLIDEVKEKETNPQLLQYYQNF
jgi:aminopeptidase N